MHNQLASIESQLNILPSCAEEELKLQVCEDKNVRLFVKRDDQIHPIISGNKWRKLKYALIQAQQDNVKQIVSFGGGYSNHIHALAYCCKQLKIRFTAIIRGHYQGNLSPMLADIHAWGANIKFVDKLTYQQRHEKAYLTNLIQQYPGALIIPEGGSQAMAKQGVAEIYQELTQAYDYIAVPIASGGTLAGLIAASHQQSAHVLGIAVLKGQGYLEQLVVDLLDAKEQKTDNWSVEHRYHFGGYAKRPKALVDWCDDFSEHSNIPVEPVYSGKLLYALLDKIANDEFPAGSKILAIHTGGLQGNRELTKEVAL